MDNGRPKIIARIAVWPSVGLAVAFWLLSAAVLLNAWMDFPDLGQRGLPACVATILGSAYLLVATFRLVLARGALLFVSRDQLVATLSLGRRWNLRDIERVDMADSKLFDGRRDQIVLTLRSGKTATVSALLSPDKAEDILARLGACLAIAP